MKNFVLFAFAWAMPVISLTGLLVGCNRTETISTAPHPTPAPTVAVADSREAEPAKMQDLLPETAVKSKNGKVLSIDLRSLSGPALTQAISLATKLNGIEEISLTGEEITDAAIEPLLELSSIVRLRLPQTRITDSTLAKLADKGSLRLLDLTDVTTIGQEGVVSIGKMSKLVELNLMNTPVNDESIASLSGLTALKKLRLRGTKITGDNILALADMPIVDLELSESNFGNAGMEAIAKMPKLEKLNLWLTKVDDQGLAKLKGKTSLKQLNLDNVAGITDESIPLITELGNLDLLHLGGTGVTESAIPQLKKLSKLKTLFITRLGVSETAAENLRKEMPWLERFEY
jgi:Leucine-rich repeat (LRR) protein